MPSARADEEVVIDETNPHGDTPLMRAVRGRDPASVEALLEAGARHEAVNADGDNALLVAVESADFRDSGQKMLKIIELLIEGGADVDFPDSSGNTAVMKALVYWSSTPAMVGRLIDAKPDVSVRNEDGRDAIFLAFSRASHKEHIPRLLELGADLRTRDHHDIDLLMLAASNADVEWVGKLLERGIRPTAVDVDGRTALHRLLGRRKQMFGPAANSDAVFECFDLLGKNGASLTATDGKGNTLLHLAAINGNARIFRELMAANEDIDPACSDGWTPLHLAAANGADEVVGLLLEKGADLELTQADGNTAFMLAGNQGHHNVMIRLAEAGADIEATDLQDRSALARAIEEAKVETARLLIEMGADADRIANPDALLQKAVRRYHREERSPDDDAFLIETLSPLVADINGRDAEGVTPLMWVAASNRLASIEAVLARQPELDARAPDGRTAMMWAACARAREGIEALRTAGADETLRDASGRSASDWLVWADSPAESSETTPSATPPPAMDEILASRERLLADYLAGETWSAEDRIAGVSALHMAAMLGDAEAIQALVELGAVVDLHGVDRVTPLMEAAANGKTKAVTLLLEQRADPTLRDSMNKRAIDHALELRHADVVRMLLAQENALATNETVFLTNLVDHGDPLLIRVALEAGASIPPVDEDQTERERRRNDFSAVMVAAAARPDPALLKLLGEFPTATGAENPAFLAAALHHASEQGRLANVRFLIEERGVDPDVEHVRPYEGRRVIDDHEPDAPKPKTRRTYSALSRALEAGHEEVVHYLVERGAPITGRNRRGLQPVAFMVQQRNHELLRGFLEKNAPTECVDLGESTALHYAVRLNDEIAVRLLLAHGADTSAVSPLGHTPLDIARREGFDTVAELLEADR